VDVVIRGDHGGGKFHMTMKVNFHLPGKQTVSYLTQIATVSYSKDNTDILRETVLDTIGECLRQISAGGRFKVLGNDLTLEFSLSNADDKSIHCSCPLKLYLVGDLKFYAQISGREDMSSIGACGTCSIPRNGGPLEITQILSMMKRSRIGQWICTTCICSISGIMV